MSLPKATAEDGPSSDGASRVGQVVSGRYRIIQLLGEGGMGAVYLAQHTHMRKRFAMKLLHPELCDNREILARFEQEAMTAAHIEHPNVAAATDFGRTEDGAFFLVLEYVEGVGLREVLERGALPARRALHIARQIALALDRAHDAGIVHRDLKPENVMLVHRGDDPDFVKVLDFGIAKVTEGSLPARGDANAPVTRLGTILGTPEYMAPEQALGEPVTPRADLYALGVMLYEMLTGKHPFDPPDRVAMLSFHIVAPVPAMEDRAPGISVSPEAEALVRRLLEKDPKARFASARELVTAIEAAMPTAASAPRLSVDPASGAWTAGDSLAKTSVPLATDGSGQPAKAASAVTAGAGAAMTAGATPAHGAIAALKRHRRLAAIVAVALPLGALSTFVMFGRSAPGESSTDARGSSASAAAEANPPRVAPGDRVRAASASGAAALEALAKEFPADSSLPSKVVLAYAKDGRTAEALRAVRRLASPSDATRFDDEVVGVVAAAAASGDEQAFALLERELGDRGIDALVDLTTKPNVRARAQRSLGDPGVRARASQATSVLLDFKAEKGCVGRRDLLERAKAEGDARLLAVLKPLRQARGCGFLGTRDCWSCLRRDSALDDAIREIEKRGR